MKPQGSGWKLKKNIWNHHLEKALFVKGFPFAGFENQSSHTIFLGLYFNHLPKHDLLYWKVDGDRHSH